VLIGGVAVARPAHAIVYPTSLFPVQNFQSLFNTGALTQSAGQPGTSLYAHNAATSPWTLQSFPATAKHTGSTLFAEKPASFTDPFFKTAYRNIITTGTSQAEWVSPIASPDQSTNFEAAGDYVFQTTFTALTSASTGYLQAANLSFNFSADNYVRGITLNGHSIYANALTTDQLKTSTNVTTTNTSFFNFGTTTAAATNTLRFTVHNNGGPVMLLTQFTTETYQPVPAPPAAISLGIGGLVGMIGTGAARMRRLRNRKKSA